MNIRREFCHHCQAYRAAVVSPFPHIAHAALTFLTCGMWSIMWAIAYKTGMGTKANCQVCGSDCR